MKELWNEFCDKCKAAWGEFWTALKGIAKSTFEILKTGCKDFVVAIFKWLKELITQTCVAAWALIKIVWAALTTLLQALFGKLYDKIMAWIEKW